MARSHLLNTPIDALTEAEVVDRVDKAIEAGEAIRIGVVNAAKIVAMQRDKLLYDDVTSSDLVLADGMSVVWASRILGEPLPERVAGIDLMFRFFELADKKGLRVYCLGATEEISKTIEANLKRDYPGLVLAGRRNGYFDDSEAEGIARDIAASRPHFLLVAMTTPRKENFMGRFADILDVPVIHGVGGSFDVYAGKVERAPESWQRLGLEWLYRVKQEPRRLWKRYAVTNVKFMWMVLKSLIGIRSRTAAD
ncbi:MAG: WecB/TagA/CpsF family glycosyltransferase [Pseudomonadales bacterium]|nr:WecB/TagA/CpsF family glycosyltransferase [Pseudomonadales bacterium]